MLSLWRQLEFSGQKLNRAQPTDTYARTPQQAVVRASHSLEGISNQVVGVVDGSKVRSSFISLLDVCFLQSLVLLTGQTQFSQIVVRRRILRLLQGAFDRWEDAVAVFGYMFRTSCTIFSGDRLLQLSKMSFFLCAFVRVSTKMPSLSLSLLLKST